MVIQSGLPFSTLEPIFISPTKEQLDVTLNLGWFNESENVTLLWGPDFGII